MKYEVSLWGRLKGDEMPRLLIRTVSTDHYLTHCIAGLLINGGVEYVKIRKLEDEKSTSGHDWYGHATTHGV